MQRNWTCSESAVLSNCSHSALAVRLALTMRWIWIDKFVEFTPKMSATAVKNVSLAEEHLHDLYPAFPIVPHSLIVEGMAQTAGILVGEARNFAEKVILAKIGRATFHRLVRPGDTLDLSAQDRAALRSRGLDQRHGQRAAGCNVAAGGGNRVDVQPHRSEHGRAGVPRA